MSRKDAIARGYANVNDDIRYHLIDKAWYGETSKDDVMRRDVDSTIAQYEHNSGSSTWQSPAAQDADDLFGYDAEQRADMVALYGSNADYEVDASDLYGESGSQQGDPGNVYGHEHGEVDAADLYGDGAGSQSSEMGDLYGHEIEQDRD